MYKPSFLWDVYKEIDKQARLKAEYDRVKTEVEEVAAMLDEYLVCLRKRESTKPPFESDMCKFDELDTLIAKMESSLIEAKKQQESIYTKLGIHKSSYSDPTVLLGRKESWKTDQLFTEAGDTRTPKHDRRRQPPFSTPLFSFAGDPPPSMFTSGSEKKSQWHASSKDNKGHKSNDPDQMTQEAHRITDPLAFVNRQTKTIQKEKPAASSENDPFKGLTRIPIPKFKGDKRSFESWYARSSTPRTETTTPLQLLRGRSTPHSPKLGLLICSI